jgi:hypothetical protein
MSSGHILFSYMEPAIYMLNVVESLKAFSGILVIPYDFLYECIQLTPCSIPNNFIHIFVRQF